MSAAIASWLKPTHTSADVERIVAGLRAQKREPLDLVAHTVPVGRGQAWLEGLAFGLEHGTFPLDQDLAEHERWRMALIPADVDVNGARRILQAERQTYGQPCDVALLALPAGTGAQFITQVKERLDA